MTEHFGGLAILGALAAGWNHVKVAIANIAGFLFVSAELENGIYRAMNIYCWTHLRRTPFGPRNYSTICSYIKPLQRYDTVMFEFTPTQSLRIPVVVFDIASMSNHDFLASWEVALQEVPCIVLLEDMDNVFQGRTNRLGRNGGGLTFDCLLNCISGIQNAEGIFLVVTTNSIESIDPALGQPDPDRGTISTRPGRIDRALKLTVMTHECRMRLARRILEDCPDLIENMVAAGDGDTPAQFQERCASAALERHWMPNGEIANRQSSIAEVA